MGLNTAIQQLQQMVQTAIHQAFPELSSSEVSFVIERTKDPKNGDYATNAAMQLTKLLRQNPRMIATALVEKMPHDHDILKTIEIAGPGFINFFLAPASLATVIPTILEQGATYGTSNYGAEKTYNVEFVSANPTGSLHLGHARQAALGDSICRLLEGAGYHVVREYYINDAGNQIHNLTLSVIARYHEACGIAMEMPRDGYFGRDVVAIAKALKKQYDDQFVNDKSMETYWIIRNYAVKKELEQIQQDLEVFRTHFDIWSSESAIRDRGLVERSLEILKETGSTYELEGATWFKTTDFGDDKDRVLIKSDQTYTYLTPDIAYHVDKLSRGYDYLVNLLGADHHGYVNRLKAAIMALGHSEEKLEVELVQMVRLLKDGEEYKMSKRSGNAVTMRELCEEVGVDAVRYFFVARSGSSHLDFDLNLATSKNNENPVYYAQYAHARMCSLMDAAATQYPEPSTYQLLTHPNEIELLKHMLEFPTMVIDAAHTRAPYKMTNYIQQLAQLFHAFYGSCRVLDEQAPELTAERVGLVKAVAIVLRNALTFIGVEAPTSM
jgi:arginyl-tRNA synthetase